MNEEGQCSNVQKSGKNCKYNIRYYSETNSLSNEVLLRLADATTDKINTRRRGPRVLVMSECKKKYILYIM
jgi:hypothetical protein